MNASRTNSHLNNWVCALTRKLFDVFGRDAASVTLGISKASIDRCEKAQHSQNLTLLGLVTLERAMVNDGLEPIFSKAHLEALGYEVRKLDTSRPNGPHEAAINVMTASCQVFENFTRAIADGRICPAEKAEALPLIERLEEAITAAKASFYEPTAMMEAAE
ncbi:hypothetical protein [Flexibacterium corallicola]|uniref:hypothetical protein n=1 Tax=Flexibacterium corallicola TaxID=3037259 RepID=UPI00286EEFF6|nr:hypothetical protein [Pseudovibrio sp. M1P-2-3]